MNQLGILAKYWQPGAVKTRLAATIGDRGASQLHRAFLDTLLQRLAGVTDRHVLAYTPPERRADFARLAGPRWTLQEQAEGALGDRMKSYFHSALAGNARRVVLIGADSPTLPRDYLQRAWDLLARYPVVLGPSSDGGYYLIGASRPDAPVFDGIDWSTCHVWRQTTERLDSAGWRFAALPPWYDVDDVTGLRRLRDELAAADASDLARRNLLAAAESLLAGLAPLRGGGKASGGPRSRSQFGRL